MTDNRTIEIGRALLGKFRVDVFLTLRSGVREIDGVPVEVYGKRSGIERRLRKLEKSGKSGWVLP